LSSLRAISKKYNIILKKKEKKRKENKRNKIKENY
jgi:hypothetical protein